MEKHRTVNKYCIRAYTNMHIVQSPLKKIYVFLFFYFSHCYNAFEIPKRLGYNCMIVLLRSLKSKFNIAGKK